VGSSMVPLPTSTVPLKATSSAATPCVTARVPPRSTASTACCRVIEKAPHRPCHSHSPVRSCPGSGQPGGHRRAAVLRLTIGSGASLAGLLQAPDLVAMRIATTATTPKKAKVAMRTTSGLRGQRKDHPTIAPPVRLPAKVCSRRACRKRRERCRRHSEAGGQGTTQGIESSAAPGTSQSGEVSLYPC
jgi:hypothetical protein